MARGYATLAEKRAGSEQRRANIQREDIVKSFFRSINARDFTTALEGLDDGAIYRIRGQRQTVGKREILSWFQQVLASLPQGAVFVLDDIICHI